MSAVHARAFLSRRPTVSLTILVLATAAAGRLVLVGQSPDLSHDIYRYRWDGRVQRAGIDPYAYAPNAPELAFLRDETFPHLTFPHLRTVYPPVAQWAFRLAAWPGSTVTAQKLVFVAAEALTVAALLAILLLRGLSPLWVLAYAWHPLPILEVAGSGHNDALAIAFLWVGLAAWQARRRLLGTVAWSAAFLSKFMSMVLVPWWWCRREGRGWLLVFVGLAALPFLAHLTAASALWDSMGAVTGRIESNASGYLLLLGLLGDPATARYAAVGLWVGFVLWWGWRQADPIRYLLGALGVMALLSPVLHPWYVTWLIPCLCFWRVPAVLALTATVVLAYTVWPGYLAEGTWRIPVWARMAEYAPVVLLGLWELRRCAWRSFFLPATKPTG